MGLLQLLPARYRRRIRRLEQTAADVATAFKSPRRPVSRSGALTDAALYRSVSQTSAVEKPRDPQPSSSTSEAASVYFSHFETRVEVDEDQTILEAGEAAGLPLDFSCRVGGCAACALQIVQGEVVYDGPICLSDEERERGMCLACVGRPRGALIVEPLE